MIAGAIPSSEPQRSPCHHTLPGAQKAVRYALLSRQGLTNPADASSNDDDADEGDEIPPSAVAVSDATTTASEIAAPASKRSRSSVSNENIFGNGLVVAFDQLINMRILDLSHNQLTGK